MTCFSELFGEVFFHVFVIEAAGWPSVILSENRAAPMQVPSCYFSRFRDFRENVDFHSSHFYRESLAHIKNLSKKVSKKVTEKNESLVDFEVKNGGQRGPDC